MNEELSYGLKKSDILKIQEVFQNHPNISKAVIYGSRAKGNYLDSSDIDITLQGDKLHYSELVVIDNELDDLMLPYTFDLSIYQQIENDDLVAHIDRVGLLFYVKSI